MRLGSDCLVETLRSFRAELVEFVNGILFGATVPSDSSEISQGQKRCVARHRDERAFSALLRSERVGLGELYQQLSKSLCE